MKRVTGFRARFGEVKANRKAALFIAAILAGGAHAWFASGTVVDEKGVPMPQVTVSVVGTDLSVMTDSVGSFRIGSNVSVHAARSMGNNVFLSGRDLLVREPGDGIVSAVLLDGLGRERWQDRELAVGGVARFRIPEPLRSEVRYLKIAGPAGVRILPVVGTGRVLSGLPALRAATTARTLQFRKDGYRDTTVEVPADSATNLRIVMASSRSDVVGVWMGDTIYSNADGRVLMESQVKLEFFSDHRYVFSLTGQANWQQIVGEVYHGEGTWKSIGSDSIEIALTTCTQPDTATLEIATFPAVVPFHEVGTGSETYYVTNPVKTAPCPLPGRVWKPWQDTMSARLPVRMVLQDAVWDLGVVKQ